MALAQDKVADNVTVVNVLGLLWNTSQDTLGLSIKSFPSLETMQPMKRAVLQDLSKIFDPLWGAYTSHHFSKIVHATALAA